MYNQFLIIGATGKTGSRVSQQLKKNGYNTKEAGRSAQITFDWEQPATWAHALRNIDAVYLTYYPDLAVPKAPDDIRKFCQLALEAGVKHITLLSGRGEPAAQTCEQIVKESGLTWTIVRASWFNQNFSEGLFQQFILDRKIALPVSLVKEPFVDVDDIADVVHASLTKPGHHSKLYEVTGPELLSFDQLAKRFSIILDEPIQFEQISMQEFRSNMDELGVDPGAIEMLTYLFGEVLDGRNEYCCNGVYEALSRSPRNFNQFILNNREVFEGAPCI